MRDTVGPRPARRTTEATTHHPGTTPGEGGTARHLFEAVVGAARRSGPPDRLSTALACLAGLDYRDGRWLRAHAAAAESVGLAEYSRRAGEGGAGLDGCLATLALVEAGLGRADACRAHAERVIAGPRSDLRPVAHAEAARALLALARADHVTALGHLDEVARISASPPGDAEAVRRWGADHVEAAAGAGERARADGVLRGLTACASEARSPELDAVALRAAGILAGPVDVDLLFQEALELHAFRPVPLEWARTRLCYGERLRRSERHDEAGDQMSAALTAFERLGARGWASRCRAGAA